MKNDTVTGQKFTHYVSAFALLLVLALTVYAWMKLPADVQIPIHWDVNGNVDGYAGKTFGLLVIPVSMVLMAAILLFLSVLEPRWEHLRQSWKGLSMIGMGLLIFFLIVQSILVLTALGYLMNVSAILAVCLGLLFCVIGNYMGKVRSNFFVGVRTPWTLSSELSWNKSNRLGGKLLAGSGLLIIVSALTLNSTVTFVIGGVSIFFIVTFTVWKSDPDRKSSC